jgi:hypothetical protein
MTTYNVLITEHAAKVIAVAADNEDEAIMKARAMVEDTGEVIIDGTTADYWWNYEIVPDDE